MESTSDENLENGEKIQQTDDVDNGETSESLERQDFTSESNKIEISNMGKFVFGVSILEWFVIHLLLICEFFLEIT